MPSTTDDDPYAHVAKGLLKFRGWGFLKKGRRALESFQVDHPSSRRQNDRCETMKRGDDVIIRKVQSILETTPPLLPPLPSRLFSTPPLYFASIRV